MSTSWSFTRPASWLELEKVTITKRKLSIQILDIDSKLIEAIRLEFEDYREVVIECKSIFETQADAVASPANSFGIMDGGIDGKLRDYFGIAIEKKVRTTISERFGGELPVGCSIATPTGNEKFKFLISAPTMRYPQKVDGTINAYLAMKAILHCALAHPSITSVAIPGLCSLTGGMEPRMIGRQMRIAYERVIHGINVYSHWREERDFEKYILGLLPFPPEDLERETLR